MKLFLAFLATTRWPAALLVSFMTWVSFRKAGLPDCEAALPVLSTFMVYITTIYINDYCDRNRDALGIDGKTFARDHEKLFLRVTAFLIAATLATCSITFMHDKSYGLIASLLCILGFSYSWTRTIPVLPVVSVSITVSLAASYPLAKGHYEIWPMILIVFLLMFAREPQKDSEDAVVDKDPFFGKRTLPLIIGTEATRAVIRSILVISGCLLLTLMDGEALPALFIAISAVILSEANVGRSKSILDFGIAVFLLHGMHTGLQQTIATGIINTTKKAKVTPLEIETERSPKRVWQLMYILMWLILFSLSSIRYSLAEAFLISSIFTASLNLLSFVGPAAEYEGNRPQYIRVIRMTIGMAIGLGAAALHEFGVPLVLVALTVPSIAITCGLQSNWTMILKDLSTVLGICAICVLLLPAATAIAHIASAYLPIVLFYHWRAYKTNIPLWIKHRPA
ncbi:MAG: UbiA family prenyltransferase [Patescibacteria group bacterium]